MTQEQRETIQRAIGMIEGLSFVVKSPISDALACATDILDSVLEKEKRNEKT